MLEIIFVKKSRTKANALATKTFSDIHDALLHTSSLKSASDALNCSRANLAALLSRLSLVYFGEARAIEDIYTKNLTTHYTGVIRTQEQLLTISQQLTRLNDIMQQQMQDIRLNFNDIPNDIKEKLFQNNSIADLAGELQVELRELQEAAEPFRHIITKRHEPVSVFMGSSYVSPMVSNRSYVNPVFTGGSYVSPMVTDNSHSNSFAIESSSNDSIRFINQSRNKLLANSTFKDIHAVLANSRTITFASTALKCSRISLEKLLEKLSLIFYGDTETLWNLYFEFNDQSKNFVCIKGLREKMLSKIYNDIHDKQLKNVEVKFASLSARWWQAVLTGVSIEQLANIFDIDKTKLVHEMQKAMSNASAETANATTTTTTTTTTSTRSTTTTTTSAIEPSTVAEEIENAEIERELFAMLSQQINADALMAQTSSTEGNLQVAQDAPMASTSQVTPTLYSEVDLLAEKELFALLASEQNQITDRAILHPFGMTLSAPDNKRKFDEFANQELFEQVPETKQQKN